MLPEQETADVIKSRECTDEMRLEATLHAMNEYSLIHAMNFTAPCALPLVSLSNLPSEFSLGQHNFGPNFSLDPYPYFMGIVVGHARLNSISHF